MRFDSVSEMRSAVVARFSVIFVAFEVDVKQTVGPALIGALGLFFMAFSLAMPQTGFAGAPASLLVSDGWFRLPPPGSSVSAGYFRLQNTAPASVTLRNVTSVVLERVELHQHQHVDGMMRMRKIDDLQIPAGSGIALEPGGYHLMLFGVPADLRDGDAIDIEIVTAGGEIVRAKLEGRAPSSY